MKGVNLIVVVVVVAGWLYQAVINKVIGEYAATLGGINIQSMDRDVRDRILSMD